MSRLIDQLRATDYPDRSARDLTIEYGQWLEQNKRDDIFAANPDFAQEYHTLKDEIDRARRPGFGEEFKGAFGSAVDELQASGYALGALAAHGANAIGVPGAEPIRNNMLKLMREQEDEAASYRPSVGSYEQISGQHPIEDTARYLTYGLGTVAPSILQSVASGLAGAAVGAAAGTAVEPGGGTAVGAVGGAMLGLAERKLAQKAVSKLLERGIKNVTLEQAAKALPREVVAAEAKRLAVQYGSQAALTLSSVGQEVGSIYGDNPDAPGTALAFGVPAGLLDVLPESYVLSRFFKPGEHVAEAAAEKATSYFRRFVTEAFKTVPMEGSTEAAQTLLEIAAAKYGRNEPVSFTDKDFKQALNAGIVGAIGGGAMAPVSASQNVEARTDPRDALAGAVVEGLPLGAAPEGVGPLEFGGEIPEADLIGRAGLNRSTRAAIGEAESVGREGFSAADAAPYALGGATGEPVGAPAAEPTANLPPAVARAVANADAAVARWGGLTIENAPEAPTAEAVPSAAITDAPLTNLVGTQVEYQGYRGTLVRDQEGNFMVLPPTRSTDKPFWIEVAGTSKDGTTLASSVALTPLEPARSEKPAPAVNIPQGPQGPVRPASKVPLGDLFPSDLAPRRDINSTIFSQPGTVAAAAANPQSVVSNALPVQGPAALPVRDQPQGGAGVRVENQVVQAPAAAGLAPGNEASPGAGAAPVVTAAPAPPAPVVKTALPTGEQAAAASGNGVPALPADSVPNLRRLRIFEQPKAPATDEGADFPGAPAPTLESQSVADNPFVVLDKAVGKLGKNDSNVAAVIVDNATGQAFVRGAYRGAANALYVDMASSRKGTATGKGSTVTPEADFQRGTEGRPAMKLFAEKLTDGLPRYTVYGVGELTKAGGPRNWNAGSAANLGQHPAVQEAARRWWTDEAKRTNGKTSRMPSATDDVVAFADSMAEWRRDHPGEKAREEMAKRVHEHAATVAKGYGIAPAKLDAWVTELVRNIEEQARVRAKQAVLLSADYLVAPQAAIDVMRSTLRALVEGREVDVAAFEQSLAGAANSAAQTTGLVIEDKLSGRKIVAFGLQSTQGPLNADTVLSVLHEAAHIATDGLAEPLRVAFQEAVEQMPASQARWLMNPRSLDIRLLANADPATLSPEQRAALGRLTPEEVAAARRIDRTALLEEQMAEHLAQLGWDRAEAKGVVQTVIRFLKDLWLRLSMAVQTTLKGPENLSPELARRFVENRFLQFIHRDSALASDRINDLLNWLGVPATTQQQIPVFPAGADWDQRMQFVDPATGRLIAVDHATYTPPAQLAYLKQAIDNAARFMRENPDPADTPDFRQTRRAAFTAPSSFTPSVQTNTVFAAINLEEEIYRGIAANPEIGPLLPPGGDFARDWLRLPDAQIPGARRQEAETWAKSVKDPTTGASVAYKAETTVDSLPVAEEKITDREGNEVTIQLTEAQDKALQQTIAALNDTQARQQRRITSEIDRVADLERLRRKNPADFPEAALRELDELKESIPLRQKIAAQLTEQKNALLAKFQPGDLVSIYPTAEYLTVPGPEATEAQIRRGPKGVVPGDLKFTDKTAFAGHLAAMDSWLKNPDNRAKGQIYGVVSEQYRKLMLIPTGIEASATHAWVRSGITGGLADELAKSGLPGLRWLSKKVHEVAGIVNRYDDPMKTAGRRWSTAAAKFAQATGAHFDQQWVERVWDPMMRVWNFIDVSERGRLGTPEEGDLSTRIEGALKNAAGVDLDSPAKRAALRDLLMQTIETERQIRTVYEANPALKVRDEGMGIYRRLVSHGLVTGRRQVARHMAGLFLQMNPQWSDTQQLGPEDVRTFWEAAGDLYRDDRAAFDKRVGELFPGYVVTDFVEPLVNNNVQLFDVTDADNLVRKASLLRVRQAWGEAEGDVTRFAERLHAIEGGRPGDEARTVRSVMTALRSMFAEIKAEQDGQNGAQVNGVELVARQMMDARRAQNWPAEWVAYATYDEASNQVLLRQLAHSAAFGGEPLGANGEIAGTLRAARNQLQDLYYRFDQMYREGKREAEIRAALGPDSYAIASNAPKILKNIDHVEKAFRELSSASNYLADEFRPFNSALGFASTMMVQNPRSAALNIADMLGLLASLKLSTPALKALQRGMTSLAKEFANSVVQAFGQSTAFNVEMADRRRAAGVDNSDAHTTWREKMNSLGPRNALAAPSGPESMGARAGRTVTSTLGRARHIVGAIGSPLQGTSREQTLSPKLTLGLFSTVTQATQNATIDAAYETFADLATRGVQYINQVPAVERAQFVRELELGVRDLDAQQLGYFGGLILNDRAAFESMRVALETKMAGESGVGRFVAKAFRRMEAAGGGKWQAVSDSQFSDIVNYSNTEWTLQTNFANMPPFMQGPLRPMFTFLAWPYLAMRRFGKQFLDAEGRLIWWGANSTVWDGMKAFFVVAAPLTIAGSFAIDWYDERILGKRQNLRNASLATALPGVGAFVDPAAFVERVGRYGSAGFASDLLNQVMNFDSQRNLSLDNRIVAVNALGSLVNSLAITPVQQGGNLTWGTVGRPFFQAAGAGGMLQYLQIAQHALGLNNEDAAINARINTGNYLRAAGREINLPVRVFQGASFAPTPVSPYLQQMELAALVNNQALFREAYRNAIDAARKEGRENPEKYVADNFADRHPLKRLFKSAPTETDYRRMQQAMGDYGAGQVRSAIGSYNSYLVNFFGKKAFYGKADESTQTVEQLIRAASRINADESASFLTIP